jgi:NADH dehydrogenase/NADH:ubiquinone oxidoreductase subunit G
MATCTFWIDGKKYESEEGTNLVDAAKEHGVFIPSLCYFKHIDPPLGTCRTCTCKINGKHNPACTESVREGLKVEVNTPELLDMRKALVEMMFAEGNHFCPACEKSGNCDLQHVGYELGISTSRFPHLFKDRLIDYQPKRMVMEHNRCIKCRRCVEEVFTSDKKRVFMYINRGNETMVGIDYEQEAKLSESEAEAAMKMCPTGACHNLSVIGLLIWSRHKNISDIPSPKNLKWPTSKRKRLPRFRWPDVLDATCRCWISIRRFWISLS